VASNLRTAIIFLGVFTVITGIIYPLIVTGVAQAFFHHQANGSLITSNGEVVGSDLIGQPFQRPGVFLGTIVRHVTNILTMPPLHRVRITARKIRR